MQGRKKCRFRQKGGKNLAARIFAFTVSAGVMIATTFAGHRPRGEPINTVCDPVYHIVEEPGAIDRLAEETHFNDIFSAPRLRSSLSRAANLESSAILS